MIIAVAVMLLGMPGMAAWDLWNYTNPWDGTRVLMNVTPMDMGNHAGQMRGFDDPWMNIDTRMKFMSSGNVRIIGVQSSYDLTETQMKNIPLGQENWMQWV